MKIIFLDKTELEIFSYRLINNYLEIKILDMPYDTVINEYFTSEKCSEMTIGNDYFIGYTNRIFTLEDTYKDISRVNHSRITVRMQFVESSEIINDIQQKVIVLQQEKEKLESSIADAKASIADVQNMIQPTVDIESMSLNEYKDYKIQELSKVCNDTICAGLDITTSKGSEHFSFNMEDQFNLKVLSDTAMLTQANLPYHTNGQQCKVYTAQDIITIFATLQRNLLYHSTYCNALYVLVDNAESKDEVQAITYGIAITDTSVKAKFSEALNAGYAAMNMIIEQYTVTEE